MHFFIITPSFNQLGFLKRCIASVKDQVGSCELTAKSSLIVHHHVQDGGSADGTREFLAEHVAESLELTANGYTFSYESAPDTGMYDAVCKGWRNTPEGVDVVAYLNCDEQYLPDTLNRVAEWMESHPVAEVLFGDVLIVDQSGQLICGRRMVRPSKYHVMTEQLPLYTAAMFVRKSALGKYGLYPDPVWKNIGDVELVLRMINQDVRIGLLHEYVALFADTGENLALDGSAAVEYERIRQRAPRWAQQLRWFWVLRHRLRKVLSGAYRSSPVEYAAYVDSLSERRIFSVGKPESRWLSRLGRTNG